MLEFNLCSSLKSAPKSVFSFWFLSPGQVLVQMVKTLYLVVVETSSFATICGLQKHTLLSVCPCAWAITEQTIQ